MFRFIIHFFRYWFAPFGKSLGIKNTRSKRAVPNEILEKAYLSKKINHKQVSDTNLSYEKKIIYAIATKNQIFFQ